MKLSAEDVRHVAQLARLRLNDDQLRAMSDTMSAILSYMDTLNEADTILALKNALRYIPEKHHERLAPEFLW